MMHREIRKAAVLGAGVMGSAIAAHLANARIPTYLLDLVPGNLTPEESARGLTLESPAVRNRLAAGARERLLKASPLPLYDPDLLGFITPGNLEDDLPRLAEVDWIIEAVVEDLAVKRQLLERIEAYRQPHAVVSTNTSGLSISAMAEGRSPGFRGHFLGTHFFNPPRYMYLLELVPGRDTLPEVVEYMAGFCDRVLGKGVVLAKDTPNFIANRLGVYGMVATLRAMMEEGLSIEEVDALTGPALGRPKTASFRTMDLVGIDVFLHVAGTLLAAAEDEAEREMLAVPGFLREMVARGWLGDKAGQGFYKKEGSGEAREILALDYRTLEYRPRGKADFPSLAAARLLPDVPSRVKALVSASDRAGRFTWKVLREMLVYAATRAQRVANDIVAVDRAMKWGFNWEMGPFELWDALGVEETARRLQNEGYPVPPLVEKLLASGHRSFYRREGGEVRYFDFSDGTFREETIPAGIILLPSLKERGRVIRSNQGASLVDLGDGVACVEFHSKENALGADAIQMIRLALDEVDRNFEGLVLGNQGHNFSVGANLVLLLLEAEEGNWEELDLMVREFQRTTMAIKYSPKPVVAAPFRITVGGGCELCLAAPRIHAAAETYMGLVEMGVGLIPAGGGTKEMLLRAMEWVPPEVESRVPARVDPQPLINRAFELIATARVSASAEDARCLGFLRRGDPVSVNPRRLIGEAKETVLAMARNGYRPPLPARVRVTGEPGYAALQLIIYTMREGGYATDHDALIAGKVARVLAGGSVSPGTLVSEQYLLDLEREAFLSLLGHPRTRDRIRHMLSTGKPLRN